MQEREAEFWAGVAHASRFFSGDADVQRSLEKLVRDLEDAGIPYAIAGRRDYPGDGKPKPVAFPDPAIAATRGEKAALLPLPTLIELKLASGMTAPHRLKDLADVLELIRVLKLDSDFDAQLDPYVRAKYHELWHAAQTEDPE